MAHILITSGPTRQYLDPVRYLTNASSGRMGAALAAAALASDHSVTVISGPVSVAYPDGVELLPVVTTEEMLQAVQSRFADCDVLIGAAAPCDYMPRKIEDEKIAKSGRPLLLELIETPDIVATAAQQKRDDQWVVGFALETDDLRFRAVSKMQKKCCDMMVSNGPSAIDSDTNCVEILSRSGDLVASVQGKKSDVAKAIIHAIEQAFVCQA